MKIFTLVTLFFLLTSCSTSKVNSYNATLDGFDYPFEVKTFSLQSQNQSLKMAYMDVGERKSKHVVVLLHGKNFSGFYWERVAKSLIEKGYRVIIPDQIGWGKSSKPKSYQFNFFQLALNTKKLLSSIGVERAIIVGHSMGGMLASSFAYEYPSLVEKLVLVNSIGLEKYSKYAQFKDTDFFYQRELSKTPEKMRNYQKKFYYDGQWSSEYEALLEPHKGQMKGGDWDLVAWNNALTYAPIFSEDVTARFQHIPVPTVLINGTRDRTGPGRGWKKEGVTYKLGQYDKLGKKVIKMFPNGKLIELQGIGHMPHFEAFDQFISLFLKELP